MFKKVLIANRGEIALRIQRACRELGAQTVAVYSEADRNAKYVRLADEAVCVGPPPVQASYLNAAAIVAAAEITGAEAVHPGYGLLSENAGFAEQVQKSGFVFIGPTPDIIRLMGDKIAAKQAARKNGLKIVPGSGGALPADPAEAAAAAASIGFPQVVKAAAGGGGRGMRVVQNEASLQNIIPLLRREARAAFGDDALYAEKVFGQSAPCGGAGFGGRQGRGAFGQPRLLLAAQSSEDFGGGARAQHSRKEIACGVRGLRGGQPQNEISRRGDV